MLQTRRTANSADRRLSNISDLAYYARRRLQEVDGRALPILRTSKTILMASSGNEVMLGTSIIATTITSNNNLLWNHRPIGANH